MIAAGGDAAFHWSLLALCSAVLGLSCAMTIGGAGRVYLPGVPVALPELCTLKRLWGLDCPGCGLTRSFIALAHGNLRAAWTYNPAGVWLFAIMAFQLPYRAVQLVRVYGKRPEISLGYVAQGTLVVLAVGLVGQWLMRVCGAAF